MRDSHSACDRVGRGRRLARLCSTVGLLVTALPAAASEPPAGPFDRPAICLAAAPPAAAVPYSIELVPTGPARGASGTATLRHAPSPFGLTVTAEGHVVYVLELSTQGLRPLPAGAYVAWAATPDLTEVRNLGALGPDGKVSSRIDLNKFLIFVTAEPSADGETWSGPIVLRGISPSGRMRSMAGHSIFEAEAC